MARAKQDAPETTEAPAQSTFERLVQAAREKATAAVRDGLDLRVGTVVDADPRFRYDINDATPTKSEAILAHRADYERMLLRMGYEVVEGAKVVGLSAPRVYAIPWVVYNELHGPAKHALLTEATAKFNRTVAVHKPMVPATYRPRGA